MVHIQRLPHAGGRVGTAAVLACVGALAVAGCSGSGSPDTSSAKATPRASSGVTTPSPRTSSAAPGSGATTSGRPPKAPKAVAVPARTAHQARQRTVSYVDTVTSVLADPTRTTAERTSPGPVTDHALAQLVNQATEYAANGWRVTGRPRVLSTTVVGRTRTPSTLTVDVCVDNSTVKVVDKRGVAVPGPASPARTRNLLTLVPRDGSWVISDQGFPDNPDC